MTKVPRAEHLAWAKKRAIAYADKGDVVNSNDNPLAVATTIVSSGNYRQLARLTTMVSRTNDYG